VLCYGLGMMMMQRPEGNGVGSGGEESGPAATPGVRGVALGEYQTNCFVVWDPSPAGGNSGAGSGTGTGVAEDSGVGGGGGVPVWIVDAGFEPGPLIELARSCGGDHGLDVQAIVLTHSHLDHIAGVREVRSAFGGKVPVWIHRAEEKFPGDPMLNLSAGWPGAPITAPDPERLLDDGERIRLGRTVWEVRHVPGHAPGNIALYNAQAKVVIAGDALFAGSIGRTDLPGGDHDLLLRSIREKLYTLPDETTVLPGHGPATTIGNEKRTNPFVRA